MRLAVYETSLEGTPPDARFWAFDTECEEGGATDFVAFGASESDAIDTFIVMLTGQDNGLT